MYMYFMCTLAYFSENGHVTISTRVTSWTDEAWISEQKRPNLSQHFIHSYPTLSLLEDLAYLF